MRRPDYHSEHELWIERHNTDRIHRHLLWSHEHESMTLRQIHVVWTWRVIRRAAMRLAFWWTWNVVLGRDYDRVRALGIEGSIWRWRYVVGKFS